MIAIDRHGGVAIITLVRPDVHNALNIELCEVLEAAVAEASDARVIVVTGSGPSFCSGADIGSVYTEAFRGSLYSMLHAVTQSPAPVIAAVNGPAIGAGTQLAIAADLRIVGPTARFAVPTARLGLAVDPWTIQRLTLLAGNSVARRLLLACDEVGAAAALESGLADRSGPLADAIAWATDIAALAPLTVRYSKRTLNAISELRLAPAVERGLNDDFEACWASDDFIEGRRARAERRPADFKGR